MKYTQEQVIDITKKYGYGAYLAYVNEAQEYYSHYMKNYIDSIGFMQAWAKEPTQTILADAHRFSLAHTALIYPPILCEQIDIYFKQPNTDKQTLN